MPGRWGSATLERRPPSFSRASGGGISKIMTYGKDDDDTQPDEEATAIKHHPAIKKHKHIREDSN